MTIKQFVEMMTDQRIKETQATWKILQFALYVTKKNDKVLITNTPY